MVRRKAGIKSWQYPLNIFEMQLSEAPNEVKKKPVFGKNRLEIFEKL